MTESQNLPFTVSVVIPSYNRLNCLKRAIESVRNQTFTPCEIIVVDDGSTDGTGEWLATTGKPDIVITQDNHGVSHARNRAIEKASGKWIALLDSDDYWYPSKLQRQVEALKQNQHMRLCHCDEHWYRNGARVNQKFKHRKSGGYIFNQCLPLCAISPSATIMQKKLFQEVGLFDESLPACEDYDLWLRITCREAVLFIDEPLLVKTGGHSDQLSQRYPAMDRFRIASLAKLLRSTELTKEQSESTYKMLNKKINIYCQGAIKRGKENHVKDFLAQYTDVCDQQFTF